jgi:hemoglobin-like flavoprotein
MITDEKKIMTIGYDTEANDNYCEYFTKEFYQGIFENEKSVRELFEKIKQDIMSKDEAEGKKLRIFPEVPFED